MDKKTLIELKAEAYDALVTIEKTQARLREVNTAIAGFVVEPSAE